MNDDQVSRTIDELEQGLAHDDPAFIRRFEGTCRAEMAMVLAVFLLLAFGTVLLTVGLATVSWPTWVAGVVAFLASFAVSQRHDRMLGRSS